MSTYTHVADYLFTHPWGILPETLRSITEIVQLRVEGGGLAEDEIRTRLAAAREGQGPRNQRGGSDGIIPIYGVLMPHANLMSEMSGGTSVDSIRASFRAFLADDSVSRIIFDVDSPGGSIEGITELTNEIRAARGIKPMTAVANFMMASCAHWLMSGVDEIVASPSSLVGAIGIYGTHVDQSGLDEQMGVKVTYVSAGKHKVEGNPHEPLGDEGLAHMQSLVNAAYEMFVRDEADGRGVAMKTVREGFGEGRVLHGQGAVDAGLADRVATLDEVREGKAPRMRARRQIAAETEVPELVATAVAETLPPDIFDFERERRHRLQKPA